MKSIAVIGVGNILFCDDGVGVYAARALEHNYSFLPSIDIIDGGTLGFNLLQYFEEYDVIIIIDTLSINDEAGSIYSLPSDALLGLGDSRKTVHEAEVTQMIELASLMSMKSDVSIIGIVPYDIQSVAIDLSDILKKRFEMLLQTVIGTLKAHGIAAHSLSAPISLEHLIASYASPESSRERFR